jgi:uncharacterized membrane protein YhiD involved in acid resistance
MPGFDFKSAIGSSPLEVPHLSQLVIRMALATVLGAGVAYRPWRRLLSGMDPPAPQGAQSQTLIAAAGALMVVVIGDNVARAFGLVGLGAFIRFRSGISDPRDAAIMFVMIGVGMACGLGLPVMAATSTAFICIILAAFDATGRRRWKRTTVAISADDPPLVLARVTELFPNTRTVELAKNATELGKDSGKILVELDLDLNADAATITDVLRKYEVPGIRRVALVPED